MIPVLCKKLVTKLTDQKGTPGYVDVTVVDDEVMACERKNNCTIQVFTKMLQLKRQIISSRSGQGTFTSLSSDKHGLLYVCCSDSTIQVLSKNGEFLRSLDTGMNCPVDICVVSPYIYVADYGKHAILVFTTEGGYVTSFGQKGIKFFNGPFGVCVDKDGFVYVCDLNQRVHIL